MKKKDLITRLETLEKEHNELKNEFEAFKFKTENPKGYAFIFTKREYAADLYGVAMELYVPPITNIYFEYFNEYENMVKSIYIDSSYTRNLSEYIYKVIDEDSFRFVIEISKWKRSGSKYLRYYEVEKRTGISIDITEMIELAKKI